MIRVKTEGVPLPVASSTGPLEAGVHGEIHLVRHGRLCIGLLAKLDELQNLLDAHSFWADGRSKQELLRMLLGSSQVVTAWNQEHALVGFGRATSDGVFRSVLWDVVVSKPYQGQGVGRRVVMALLECPAIGRAERIYLMTTNSSGFYEKIGFKQSKSQKLLVKNGNQKSG
jgi:ribosomal protein S18 acetylase RimI-like enzyme